MKLSQVYEQLTAGELRNLKIGGAEEGAITEANSRAIANHVILGLTALYTRFNLKENSLIVELKPDRFSYPLQSKFAVSNMRSQEPVKFIADTVDDKFLDDLLKIERVIAVDTKCPLSVNDHRDEYSIVTPAMDTIRVPADMVNQTAGLDPALITTKLQVFYRANHPTFFPRLGYFDPQLVEIELPMSHLQALLYFVASRVNNPIGMTNEFNAGNNYAAKYELECKRLENEGVEIDTLGTNTRARRKGWV